MRYGADHKRETRQRILNAAATVFRRQGLAGGSVDDVMREAGLTAGGFYAHFGSKDELFAEALTQLLQQGRVVRGRDDEDLEGSARVESIARKYLSPAHRRMVEQGCPMPPLLAELPRHGVATRRAFEQTVGEGLAELEPHLAGGKAEPEQAWAVLALLVGGMSLSRAVADERLADRILIACRRMLEKSLAAGPTPAKKSRISKRKSSTTARKKGTRPS